MEADFNLDQRVRADNPLRAIRAAIDFDFVRPLVRPLYGVRGHESVDPTLLLKLMFGVVQIGVTLSPGPIRL